MLEGGAVYLYHNGTQKFETTSTGASLTGSLLTTGNLNPSGYIKVLDGSDGIYVGTGNDLQIYHNGTSSYISNTTGNLYIEAKSGETAIQVVPDGAVDLRYNGNKKLETNNNGVNVTGALTVNGSAINTDLVADTSPQLGGDLDTNSHHILIDDDHEVKWGDNSDLRVFHSNGNANFIQSYNGNSLRIHTFGTSAQVKLQTNESEDNVVCKPNGATELFYDGGKKLETGSGGVTVTGTMSTSGISISNGAGAVTVNANSDIRFTSGSWTGDSTKIQQHGNWLYLQGAGNGIILRGQTSDRWYMNANGHFYPASNNTFDIGTTSNRVRNIYTNDLHLSNKGSSNDVDSTWGDWTIQEGESDLFLKNNRSGKKYKFNLTEVS